MVLFDHRKGASLRSGPGRLQSKTCKLKSAAYETSAPAFAHLTSSP